VDHELSAGTCRQTSFTTLAFCVLNSNSGHYSSELYVNIGTALTSSFLYCKYFNSFLCKMEEECSGSILAPDRLDIVPPNFVHSESYRAHYNVLP
jgi:hypothetical protein